MNAATSRRPSRAPVPGFFALVAATLLGVACVDHETQEATGAELFAQHCAACHGVDAAGDGPLATELKLPPPDLRRIASRAGGRFDEAAVLGVVDGRHAVAAHGPRDMPVWGKVFTDQKQGEPMPVYRAMGNARALVDYLRTIQLAEPAE